jgi:hypothetical protein
MLRSIAGDDVEPIEIDISSEVLRELDLYIVNCATEISGVGDVEVMAAGSRLQVDAIYLLDQVSTDSDTMLDGGALAAFMHQRIVEGGSPETIKLWWHSHNNMAVFWSPTDDATIESFAYTKWLLSIVGNHRREYLARLDLFPSEKMPFRVTLPARLNEVRDYDPSVSERILREITERVTQPVVTRIGRRRASHVAFLDQGGADA